MRRGPSLSGWEEVRLNSRQLQAQFEEDFYANTHRGYFLLDQAGTLTQARLRKGDQEVVCWIRSDHAKPGKKLTLSEGSDVWTVAEIYETRASVEFLGTCGCRR